MVLNSRRQSCSNSFMNFKWNFSSPGHQFNLQEKNEVGCLVVSFYLFLFFSFFLFLKMVLRLQLLSLKTKESSEVNIKRENEGSWSNGSENSCDVNLDLSRSAVNMASPVCNSQLSSKHLFPSSMINRTTNMTQLLQGTSRQDLQCLKLDQVVQEENFCNMFNNIDQEQQGFWAWPEHQNYH